MGRSRPRLAIITPSWLKVERAIIFFMSISNIAAIPAISIVREAIRRREVLKNGVFDREG